MKIFVVTHDQSGKLISEAGGDSSILRPGEPVFIPEPLDGWISSVAPAVRIARLGTCIKSSLARRYYTSLCAMHVLRPTATNIVAAGLPPYMLDRTFSPGEWIDISEKTADDSITMNVRRTRIGSTENITDSGATFSIDSLAIDRTIEHLSQLITFKTGDILVFADHAVNLDSPLVDTAVSADINTTPSLSIRIK